ncbi:MAG: GH1 family beta-glucosidase [Planctomycetota bacterium]
MGTGFPKDFAWGAAAASYQIEGVAYEDGKGLSTWDVFCRRPGAVWMGQSGDVACDHYHRYAEDVALMKEVGLKAYRLSISWPRVMPEGTGKVNPKGLGFYDRLIDELTAKGIEPYVTLFHWDYPHELYCRGGWLNRESPDWFAEYASVIADRLSDRVANWMTLNEPNCFVGYGHIDAVDAPGLKLDLPDVLRLAHHVLLAHGKAVEALRARAKGPCRVGMAPAYIVRIPATDDPADVEAARTAMFSVDSVYPDTICSQFVGQPNYWWMDPIFLGRYPEEGLKYYGAAVPKITGADLETISQPLDFCGVNIYWGRRRRMGKDGKPEPVAEPVGGPLVIGAVPVTPEALYWGPKFLYERYGKPIVITENGMANPDWIASDGKVHDPQRIDFLRRYLSALRAACEDGVPVRGYFQWSIMDNFEWGLGYGRRLGLIYVDYPTQRRIIKDSGRWYSKVIASNGAALSEP